MTGYARASAAATPVASERAEIFSALKLSPDPDDDKFLALAVDGKADLTVGEVEAVLRNPDGRIPQTRDKAILYKRPSQRSNNLIAAVVVEMATGGITEIITVLINFEVKK